MGLLFGACCLVWAVVDRLGCRVFRALVLAALVGVVGALGFRPLGGAGSVFCGGL